MNNVYKETQKKRRKKSEIGYPIPASKKKKKKKMK